MPRATRRLIQNSTRPLHFRSVLSRVELFSQQMDRIELALRG